MSRPRVLVLSRNYPSPALPTRGLWVERLARAAAANADVTVVAPVPAAEWRDAIGARRPADAVLDVRNPWSPAGAAHRLLALDARIEQPIVVRLAERLHRERPFDLIHAHFMYPDGVVAAAISQRLGVPVMTTEHAFWRLWPERAPSVWRQIRSVLPDVSLVSAVSDAVRREIEMLTDGAVPTEVLHNVVDDETFHADGRAPEPEHLLFVGVIRHVKGLDVLLHAVARLAARRPAIRLTVVGEAFIRGYRADEARARALLGTLGLTDRVSWIGQLPPDEVAALMRRAAVVVVPSRRESFCSVAAEALSCGTPVVATRCGGPEEIITPDTGRLVATEDPAALADGIEAVLESAARFDPARLRESSIARFGRARAEDRLRVLYDRVLRGGRTEERLPA